MWWQLILITWLSYALKWLLDLKSCECALGDWRRTYMIGYYTLLMGLLAFELVGTRVPRPVWIVLTATFIPVSISYIQALRDCECSEARQRNIIFLVSNVQAIGLLFFWAQNKK